MILLSLFRNFQKKFIAMVQFNQQFYESLYDDKLIDPKFCM